MPASAPVPAAKWQKTAKAQAAGKGNRRRQQKTKPLPASPLEDPLSPPSPADSVAAPQQRARGGSALPAARQARARVGYALPEDFAGTLSAAECDPNQISPVNLWPRRAFRWRSYRAGFTL